MKNRNKRILLSAVLLDVFLLAMGITYAFFNYTALTNEMVLKTGEVYMKLHDFTDTINLENVFPETREEAILRTDNIITFSITGTNTYKDELYYDIKAIYGEDITDRVRIDDKDVKLDLIEITDPDHPVLILSNFSLDTINDVTLNVDTYSNLDEHDLTRTYTLRMWISDSVLISDTDPNKSYCASEYCDVLQDLDDSNDLPIYKDLFMSFKVKVFGDYTKKYNPFAYMKLNKYHVGVKKKISQYTQMDPYVQKMKDEGIDINTKYSIWPNDEYLLNGEEYIYDGTNIYDEDNPVELVRNPNGFTKYIYDLYSIDFLQMDLESINEELDKVDDPDNTEYVYKYELTDPNKNGAPVYLYITTETVDSKVRNHAYIVSPGIIMFPEDSSEMFSIGRTPNIEVWYYYGKEIYDYYQENPGLLHLTYDTYEDFINYMNVLVYCVDPFDYWATDQYIVFNSSLYSKHISSYYIGSGYILRGDSFGYIVPDNYSNINLYSINFDNVNTSNVTNMEGFLMGCVSLHDFDVTKLNTRNVTNMEGMFGLVNYKNPISDIIDINLNYLDTHKVTNMSYMFCNLKANVNLIGLEDLNTSSVTDMSGMFTYNYISGTLDLSNWDVSNVIYFGGDGVYGDPSFGYVVLDGTLAIDYFNTSSSSGMFSGSSFTSINMSTWDTSNGVYFGKMFESSKVTSLDIGNFNLSNAVALDYFAYGTKITSLDLSNKITNKVKKAIGLIGGTSVVEYNLSHSDFSGLEPRNQAIYFNSSYMENTEKVDLSYSNIGDVSLLGGYKAPSYVDISNSTTDSTVFPKLTSSATKTFLLNNFNGESVTDISNMISIYPSKACRNTDTENAYFPNIEIASNAFSGCDAETLDLRGFNFSKTTDVSYMFNGSGNINVIYADDVDMSNVTNTSYMYHNSSMTTIDVSMIDLSKVTNADSMFLFCYDLETIYASNDLNPALSSSILFRLNGKLRGGQGTNQDVIGGSDIETGLYARIDNRPDYPGLFTLKTN